MKKQIYSFLFILFLAIPPNCRAEDNKLTKFLTATLLTEADWWFCVKEIKYSGSFFSSEYKVSQPFPSAVVELVHEPFQTHFYETEIALGAYSLSAVEIINKAVSKIEKLALSGLTEKSIASSQGILGGAGKRATLHFADARWTTFVLNPTEFKSANVVIAFLSELMKVFSAIPPSTLPLANYISEYDFMQWRSNYYDSYSLKDVIIALAKGEKPIERSADSWGNFFPRSGFVLSENYFRSMMLIALRAGRCASDPFRATPFKIELDIDKGKSSFSATPNTAHEPRTGHYMQLISPTKTKVLKIGNEKDLLIAEIEFNKYLKKHANRPKKLVLIHYAVFERDVKRKAFSLHKPGEVYLADAR